MGTRKSKNSGADVADWVGFDVITSSGRRVGVVEDVCKVGSSKVGTCLLLSRRIPGKGETQFLLPLRRVVFDPIQYCFVWNDDDAPQTETGRGVGGRLSAA